MGRKFDHTEHAETSASVLVALADARDRGLLVPDVAIENGLRFLATAFQSSGQQDDERKAALVLAQARLGQDVFEAANRLHRERNRLSAVALADTTRALVALGRKPMAQEAAEVLAGSMHEDGSWATQDCTPWNRNVLEVTARALLALQEAAPQAPELAQGMAYIHANRPWAPRRARGTAVACMAR
jgi:hypothetical protein